MNAPTLLIGLGGTGSKIVERVSKMVTTEQRSSIAFAVFDTDINELRAIQERNPFVKTIQTSTKQTVGEYLNKDTHARDSWFPVNAILNGKTLTEGAGQVRSISRLALETCIRAGKMEPLHQAIQSLYKVEEDKADQALRVVIVSSLAGGTGSGLILPVALYVRNYLKTHFRQSANITRGFFILPEVFYEVIPGTTERNNLKANAYATLRELDAFLMKGDATLPAKFRDSVRIQFPRAASAGFEEYDVRPYDFCFLFDAQNAEGSKLNSFDQYLDHAANCIYSQSIGPMNKRSNSSEDNTIRKLAKERGRNRYAGAGASMLIYPYEDIRRLIALRWTKQSVSKLWLKYDNQYKEMRRENEKNQEEGITTELQPLASYYAAQIETDAEHGEAFAKAIYRASGVYKNGVTRTSDRWETYVKAILDKTAKDIRKGTPALKAKLENARELVNNLGNDWSEYATAYNEELEYYLIAQEYVEEVSKTIAFSMFKGSDSSQFSLDADFKLENYLVNTEGKFIHPNAVRFMLIKIHELMKKYLESISLSQAKNKKYFDTFEKNTFDDTETDDREETADDLANKKVSIVTRLSKRPNSEQTEMQDKLRMYLENSQKYQVECAQTTMLRQGIAYIDSLIAAFEGFFSSFDSKVEGLDKSISDILKKYSDSTGTTVRYVCVSEKCLKAIFDKKPYTGSPISIDPDLSRKIYQQILTYSQIKDQPNNNRFFSDLFDTGIVGFFEDVVTKDYGADLDVDIIKAIQNEADLEGRFEEEDDAYRLIDMYVRKTIQDTRKLSCPFIESPMGEEREPINACTFNKELRPEKGDESPKAKLIRSELLNYGGEPDEDIPKNMIMFYQSFYGLRANDLSKFAPPEKSITYNRSSGEYFTAYYELAAGIHPEAHRSKEISPHIDRWWHIITKMPDLDEDNQKKQEHEIYAAFFWALLNRLVYPDESSDIRLYKLKNVRLKMEDDTLVVSNGTTCDKLYEVLDAIAIYPELVTKILKDVEVNIAKDVNDGTELEDTMLCSQLRTLAISEPGIGADSVPARSIFDIPMLMKKSATPNTYYEQSVIEMLTVELDEIKKYLAHFCTAKELNDTYGKLVLAQFEKHLADMELEKQIHPSLYRESLFDKSCDTIINTLEEAGLRKEARQIREKVAELV